MKSGALHLSLDSCLGASGASDGHFASNLCPYHLLDGGAMSASMKTLQHLNFVHQQSLRQHIFVIFDNGALDFRPDQCCVSCRQNDDDNYDGDVSDEESGSGLGFDLRLLV